MRTDSQNHRLLFSAILFWAVSPLAWAQKSDANMDIPEVPEQIQEYQVGPGDVLSINVFGVQEFDQSVTISNSGKIHVRYAGIIEVAFMTTNEIEQEISRRLEEEKLLREPWVRVLVTQFRSQPVFVIGEVNSPGQFMMTGDMHLLDALNKAGGVTPGSAREGYLIRRHNRPMIEVRVRFDAEKNQTDPTHLSADLAATGLDQPGKQTAEDERITINLRDLREGRDPELNVRLQGGDVFYIPRRQRQHIYIVGEVLFPGAYGLPQYYDHISAARAVAFAGGVLKTAKTSKAFVMRKDENGAIQGLPFDFVAVHNGKEPDVPVRPDDIIFVPRSVAKTIGYNMLILVPHLVQQFMIF